MEGRGDIYREQCVRHRDPTVDTCTVMDEIGVMATGAIGPLMVKVSKGNCDGGTMEGCSGSATLAGRPSRQSRSAIASQELRKY